MKSNYIKPTSETPSVFFSHRFNEVDICGTLKASTKKSFCERMLKALDEYTKTHPRKLEINFSFEHLGNRSQEFVLMVLERLEHIGQSGMPVKVNWFHDKDDQHMKKIGKTFAQAFKHDFNIKTLPVINA